MAQLVLLNKTGAQRPGAVFDSGRESRMIADLRASGGVLVPVDAVMAEAVAAANAAKAKGVGDDVIASMILSSYFASARAGSVYTAQTDWYVDPVNGDDDATGLSGEPIATVAELMRRLRMGGVSSTWTQVYLLGDLDEDIIVDVPFRSPGAIAFHGQRTVLYSGTISAVAQNWDVVAQTDGRITVAGLPVSFTASGLVGKFIRLTSGVNAGAIGVIGEETVAKTARVGFYNPDTFAGINPVGGETFEVYDVTEVNGSLHLLAPGIVALFDLQVNSNPTNFICVETRKGNIFAVGCRFAGVGYADIYSNDFNSFFICHFKNTGNVYVNGAESLSFFGGYFETPVFAYGGTIQFGGFCWGEGAGAYIAQDTGGGVIWVPANSCYASFGKTGATAVLRLAYGGIATLYGSIFGTGATGFGAKVLTGSQLQFGGATIAANYGITGVLTADIRYGATDATYAVIGAGAIDATTHAAVVPLDGD